MKTPIMLYLIFISFNTSAEQRSVLVGDWCNYSVEMNQTTTYTFEANGNFKFLSLNHSSGISMSSEGLSWQTTQDGLYIFRKDENLSQNQVINYWISTSGNLHMDDGLNHSSVSYPCEYLGS